LSGLQMLEGLRTDAGAFAYGWIGVDVFFIISGFIMVWVTRDISSTPQTALRFIISRIVRIYPLWWVCVSFVALFFFLVHGFPASLDVIPKEFAWGYYARSLLLWPQELAPLLDVGWTLIHEMFFYLVFTLIIAIGIRRKLLLALLIWGILTASGIILNFGHLNPFFKIVFNPLSFLFIIGALIGSLRFATIPNKYAWLGLVLSIAIIFSLITFGLIDKGDRVIQLIIPLSLFVLSLVTLEQAGKIKTPKLLLWLGAISYALYLTHPLVILAWRVIRPFYEGGLFSRLTETLPSVAVIYLDMTALLVAFLITATLFHFCIEKPSLRLAKHKLKSYRSKSF